MSEAFARITIRAAIKTIRNKPKRGIRHLILSCGRSDAGRIGRLALLEGFTFDVEFVAPPDKNLATVTLRAEIESLDTQCETSSRSITLAYVKEDSLKVQELGTHEKMEFIVTFVPAEAPAPLVKPEPAKKDATRAEPEI